MGVPYSHVLFPAGFSSAGLAQSFASADTCVRVRPAANKEHGSGGGRDGAAGGIGVWIIVCGENAFKVGVCMLGVAALMTGCAKLEPVSGMEQLPKQMAPFARKVADSKLPHINVTPIIGPTMLWDSKLRGVPYYPKELPWPTDPRGEPLVMLAQINFADMPPLAGYPNEGILQLYISTGYDPEKQMWGMCNDNEHASELECLTDQSYFRAVYFPTVALDIDQLISETPKVEYDEEYGFPAEEEARLQFSLGSSYVRPDDYRFRRFFGKDRGEFFRGHGFEVRELEDAYEKFIGGLHYGTRIGGYSRVEQLDPRLKFADEDWVLLFSLDSEMNTNYPASWGDGGIGNFYIRSEDLAKRDFSKVMYYWDFG
jgi:uncharacterized protein YwqG